LQASILNSLSEVLPEQAYSFLEGTILQIVSIHNGGLLSLGFVMAFYFASRGVIGIMKAFNRSAHIVESRSFIKMQLISFALLLILITIVIIAAGIMILTPIFLKYVITHSILTGKFSISIIQITKWLVLAFLVFLSLSFIYYLAPAGKRVFRFLSPGSIMATFLTLVFMALFNLYIDNFGQYNKLYGSIGTIIVLMMFINVNAIALLIGYELNASIYDAHLQSNSMMEDE
jgi:membrane protein